MSAVPYRRTFARLLSFLRPYRRGLVISVVLAIGSQAFSAVPKAHYAAVVLAAIPSLAQWGSGMVHDALLAAGTSVEKVGVDALANGGVLYGGLGLVEAIHLRVVRDFSRLDQPRVKRLTASGLDCPVRLEHILAGAREHDDGGRFAVHLDCADLD